MAIIESAVATALGAIVGFVEKPIAQYMDLKAKKEENRHVETLQDKQHAHDLILAEKELFSEGIKADTAIMTESYKHDASHGESYKWVVAVCKLTRPVALLLTFGGTIYDAGTFGPYLGLILAWWFASRVRPTYPK